jgi:hypothetical protein
LLKGSGLKSFVPDDEPITVPPEDLDAIAAPIEKEEEVTREWVLLQEFPNHALKTIDPDEVIWDLELAASWSRRRFLQ